MENFRLLKRTRQLTDYSCGASALQSVLSYWGIEIDEKGLMERLGTSEAVGTFPEQIVRVAKEFGLDAEAISNMTLDEVKKITAKGDPMIGLAQAWISSREASPSVEVGWDDGHYIVILGVDNDYVYYQDPFARMSKFFVPRTVFERHWHQIMGGEKSGNPELHHLAIRINGDRRPDPDQLASVGARTLDFRKFGSFNIIAAEFAGVMMPFDFFQDTREIWESTAIRLNAVILLRKDKDGTLSGMEGSRLLENDDAPEMNALLAAIASSKLENPNLARSKLKNAVKAALNGDFGLSMEDLRSIGAKISENRSVLVVVFENFWERKYREIVAGHGGKIVSHRLLGPEVLANFEEKFAHDKIS